MNVKLSPHELLCGGTRSRPFNVLRFWDVRLIRAWRACVCGELIAMATWRDVRRFALALPQTVEETSSDGKLSWSVNKKGFVWERPLRPKDREALKDKATAGPILGVRTADLEMKEMLLASDPKVFFTTPHFDGYPAVLVRLDKIAAKKLKDVIEESWLARAPKPVVTAFLKKKQ